MDSLHFYLFLADSAITHYQLNTNVTLHDVTFSSFLHAQIRLRFILEHFTVCKSLETSLIKISLALFASMQTMQDVKFVSSTSLSSFICLAIFAIG